MELKVGHYVLITALDQYNNGKENIGKVKEIRGLNKGARKLFYVDETHHLCYDISDGHILLGEYKKLTKLEKIIYNVENL